jgi:protein phosphatase
MLRAIEIVALTDTGLQRRDNEDAKFARAPVFVVADGMGGAQAGEVASKIAVEAFEQGLPDQGSPEEQLATRAREANKRIYAISREERERAGMGTTLTAAYLGDHELSVAHVGDSRAYLFRDGELQRLTQDHSLVDELVRQGKLTSEQAAEHPQRSIITRALGPEEDVEVDTWSYPLRNNDVVLLCSDGLTSMVSEERLTELLAAAASLEDAGQALIRQANEAGGRDNITVVLFRAEEVGAGAEDGDDDGLDQPTMVQPPAAEGPRRGASTQATVPPPPAGTGAPSAIATRTRATPPPLARTQGRPGEGRPGDQRPAKRRRPFSKPLAAAAATVIVLALIIAGGYLASRQLYFVGTNAQGIVTIYRGLPYDLPASVHLYETFYVSGVPASAIPSSRVSSMLDHHLRSQADATRIVRDLELGKVSK